MTYKRLAEMINKMTDEQQNCDVIIYLEQLDEYLPADCLMINRAIYSDVLDDAHPFLIIDY